jgi:hypothetical protein
VQIWAPLGDCKLHTSIVASRCSLVCSQTTSTKKAFTSNTKVTQEAAPKKQAGLQLGFTKENELFVGRAAMLGFAFSLIGELLTGKGALAQLGYEVFDDKIGTLQIDELVSLIARDHLCNPMES